MTSPVTHHEGAESRARPNIEADPTAENARSLNTRIEIAKVLHPLRLTA